MWAGVGALLALAINQPLGSAVARPRPYLLTPNMHLLVYRTKDFSFASDHATIAGAVAAAGGLPRCIMGVMAAAHGFARVYVGARYPGDVLAGLLLGAVVVLGLSVVGLRIVRPLLAWVSRTPLRPVIASSEWNLH